MIPFHSQFFKKLSTSPTGATSRARGNKTSKDPFAVRTGSKNVFSIHRVMNFFSPLLSLRLKTDLVIYYLQFAFEHPVV